MPHLAPMRYSLPGWMDLMRKCPLSNTVSNLWMVMDRPSLLLNSWCLGNTPFIVQNFTKIYFSGLEIEDFLLWVVHYKITVFRLRWFTDSVIKQHQQEVLIGMTRISPIWCYSPSSGWEKLRTWIGRQILVNFCILFFSGGIDPGGLLRAFHCAFAQWTILWKCWENIPPG